MTTIQQRIDALQTRISQACNACHRDPLSVRLVAVSKTQAAAQILEAYDAGIRHFGENYLQESLEKIQQCSHLQATWHFIGPVQANKTADIAEHFDWVQSIDRLKIAQRLNDARPSAREPIQVCIQVNISNEQSKSGLSPVAAEALAKKIAQLPNLNLRGLMCIAQQSKDPSVVRAQFNDMRGLKDRLSRQGHRMDTLSMGMSADLEPAIANGSTMIRIGTDIFGSRAMRNSS